MPSGKTWADVLRGALAFLLLFSPAAGFAGHELEGRNVRNGQSLYAEHCASCHGTELEGQPNWRSPGRDGLYPAPPHDGTGHTWHHDNRLLFDYTKLGGDALFAARGIAGARSGMSGFADVLTDEGIWDILAYIRSTWPDRIKKVQAARNPAHRQ